MNYTFLAASIDAIAVTWHIVVTMMIYEALRKRGLKVSFIFLRLLAPKYVSQYRETTRKETGKTGPLFYHWIVSINTAWVAAILLILDQISRGRS
jgi:hypothetical protein